MLSYGAACAYLFIFQRNLIYLPDEAYVAPDAQKLPNVEEITIKTDDGLSLTAWFVPSQNDKYILYFNGNKSGIHLHQDFYATIIQSGYGLLAFNYRGYGGNKGEPTEQGLYNDARAAVAFLQHRKIALENIIFLGRSLGSGVAVQIATEYLPLAIALISPYSSIADVAKLQYPYIPIDFLLVDKFDSMAKSSQIASPTFIFHGADDLLIPISQAQKLHEAINGSELFIYKNQDHDNLDFGKIIADLNGALNERLTLKKKVRLKETLTKTD